VSEHALFQIPLAAEPIRWITGAVCVVFVLAIFGSWMPRVIPWLLHLPRKSPAQTVASCLFALLPIAIGFGPLVVLIALIRNPMTYISDSGVTKEGVFSKTPDALTWAEVVHVSCSSGRGSGPRSFTFFSSDGRKIGFGNTGAVDFHPLHIFLEDRLGPGVMSGCPRAYRGTRSS
jgi:hypothetical protein